MGVGDFRCMDDLLHGRVFYTEGYVVEYRVIEEDRFLIVVSDKASESLDPYFTDVGSVDSDSSFTCVIITRDKVCEGRFS